MTQLTIDIPHGFTVNQILHSLLVERTSSPPLQEIGEVRPRPKQGSEGDGFWFETEAGQKLTLIPQTQGGFYLFWNPAADLKLSSKDCKEMSVWLSDCSEVVA